MHIKKEQHCGISAPSFLWKNSKYKNEIVFLKVTIACNVLLQNIIVQRSFHLCCDATEELLACCIDFRCWRVALCSRMQSSGPAQDSRREPSASKFSSHWQNPAAAAIINGPSTSQPAGSLCSPVLARCVFLSCSPVIELSLRGSSVELHTLYCNELHLQLCPPVHAFIQASWCPQLRTRLHKNDDVCLQPCWCAASCLSLAKVIRLVIMRLMTL